MIKTDITVTLSKPNLFILNRYAVNKGLKFIIIDIKRLIKVSGLHSLSDFSEFGLNKFHCTQNQLSSQSA